MGILKNPISQEVILSVGKMISFNAYKLQWYPVERFEKLWIADQQVARMQAAALFTVGGRMDPFRHSAQSMLRDHAIVTFLNVCGARACAWLRDRHLVANGSTDGAKVRGGKGRGKPAKFAFPLRRLFRQRHASRSAILSDSDEDGPDAQVEFVSVVDSSNGQSQGEGKADETEVTASRATNMTLEQEILAAYRKYSSGQDLPLTACIDALIMLTEADGDGTWRARSFVHPFINLSEGGGTLATLAGCLEWLEQADHGSVPVDVDDSRNVIRERRSRTERRLGPNAMSISRHLQTYNFGN
ncbi:unnamed protein product [Sympodiomycopsis kandeliae]